MAPLVYRYSYLFYDFEWVKTREYIRQTAASVKLSNMVRSIPSGKLQMIYLNGGYFHIYGIVYPRPPIGYLYI